MSELPVICSCGSSQVERVLAHISGVVAIACSTCCVRGPGRLHPDAAIAAWNALMRPRPVAEWRDNSESFWVGSLEIGLVYRGDGARTWIAAFSVTCERRKFRSFISARAWLESRVRDAGFEIREST